MMVPLLMILFMMTSNTLAAGDNREANSRVSREGEHESNHKISCFCCCKSRNKKRRLDLFALLHRSYRFNEELNRERLLAWVTDQAKRTYEPVKPRREADV